MEEACRAAAHAVEHPIFIATTEPERKLVAARTVQAVATAISTSPTYPSEERDTYPAPGIFARRRLNALNSAVEAGMDAYAEENDQPPDGDNINSSDSRASSNSDSDSDSTPILKHPYAPQSSIGHNSPGRWGQRPISHPSES